MTYPDRVRDYPRSIAPDGATNSELARQLGIRSKQTAYMLTQQLIDAWDRSVVNDRGRAGLSVLPTRRTLANFGRDASPAVHFKVLAGRVLAAHYCVVLEPSAVPAIRNRFDFVQADRQMVGDAHHFTKPA
jgi:hypothetical protein